MSLESLFFKKTGENPIINKQGEIGNYDFENDFLYGLSVAKSEQSLTTQDFVKGKRIFKPFVQ